MEDFSISSKSITPKVAITQIGGEVGTQAFDILEDEFGKLVDAGIMGIVVDLSQLQSISSASIGILVNASRVMSERNGMLIVIAVPKETMELFTMMTLHEKVTFAENLDAAKKLLADIH